MSWMILILPSALAAQAAPAAPATVTMAATRLRPGDVVAIEVENEPTLTGQIPIGADGRALFPLVGFVEVADRPFGEVTEEVTRLYATQVVDPVLRLTPMPRIAILGEVRVPGLYPIDPTYTIADAIARAGGLGPLANHRISLVRRGKVVLAKLDPRSSGMDVQLQSGDQILVGRRGWFSEYAPILIGAAASVAAAAVTSFIVR